ncbi:BRO-N domain-containing protein [Acidithiobacillus caldus]
MQEIVPFDFQGNAVRIVCGEDRNPWFNANDVCQALGYANARDALSNHVDEDDVAKRDTIDALGRTQQVNYINESGLYALIFGSTKPEAKVFKRWVTHEVLPAIRKTGRYSLSSEASVQEAIENNLKLVDLLRSCMALYGALGLRGQKRLTAVQKHLRQQYSLDMNAILPGVNAGRTLTLSELGAAFGKSPDEVRALLQELGLQILKNGEWVAVDPDKVLFRVAAQFSTKHRFLDELSQDGTTKH